MSFMAEFAAVGLLADTDIVYLIEKKCIVGLPSTTSDYYAPDSPVQAASVDLHIGGIFLPRAAADEAAPSIFDDFDSTILADGSPMVSFKKS